jgi:hypothetical protein
LCENSTLNSGLPVLKATDLALKIRGCCPSSSGMLRNIVGVLAHHRRHHRRRFGASSSGVLARHRRAADPVPRRAAAGQAGRLHPRLGGGSAPARSRLRPGSILARSRLRSGPGAAPPRPRRGSAPAPPRPLACDRISTSWALANRFRGVIWRVPSFPQAIRRSAPQAELPHVNSAWATMR